MKKIIIFAVIFILLFSFFQIFQVLSGMLLTAMYTPDAEGAWIVSGNLTQEVIIRGGHSSYLPTLFIALLAATIAYFAPKKLLNKK